MAKRLVRRKLAKGRKITQPPQAFEHLQLLLQGYEYEVFSVLFLDSQHRVIRFEELFRGTIDAASVYLREVLKATLAYNAAAVILVHNHPSGDPEPSDADRRITQRQKEALGLRENRVLDHVVVGREGVSRLRRWDIFELRNATLVLPDRAAPACKVFLFFASIGNYRPAPASPKPAVR